MNLFEVCAVLTMDTAAFEESVKNAVRQGEQLASTMEQRLPQAGRSAVSAWQAIEQQIRAATAAARAFFAVQGSTGSHGFATGLRYVPHDNFQARLHEGEAVLTKLEAANWRAGGTGQGQRVAMNPESVGEAVRGALAGMSVSLDGEKVGKVVAESVSAQMGRASRERRLG